MKSLLCLPVIIVFFIVACNDNGVKKDEPGAIKSTDAVIPDSVVDRQTGDSIATNIQVDSVIHLAFPKDSVSVSVQGHVNKKGEPVICMLPVTMGKKLTARITADKQNAKLRFSHIDFPDGSADGPFGNFLQYDLKQKGLHKLYIAPNMMAGDPVSTDFILHVTVE